MNENIFAIPLQQWGGEIPVDFNSSLTIGLVSFYFILMIGIGVYAARHQSDEVDYYAAGRRSGIFVVAMSAFAAIASGWGMVGIPGSISIGGIEIIIVQFTPLGFVVAYWLLAKKMRVLGDLKDAITAPDALYHRFDEDDHVRLLGAISIILGCIGYLAAQYAAMGIIGAVVFPFGFYQSLILGMAVVGIYAVLGGILASIWTDTIQGVMMALSGPLAFFYIVTELDMGLNGVVSSVIAESPDYFDLSILGGGSEGSVFAIGFALSSIFIILTFAGQPQLVTKFYMVREVKMLRWGALISGLGYLLVLFFWISAVFVRAGIATGEFLQPANPDYALPIAIIQSAPEIVVAFVLSAILAGIMSTSNNFINVAAASIQHDIIQEYYGYDLAAKQQVNLGRVITAGILIAGFVVASTFPGLILTLGAAGWALMASVVFPGVAIAYNWKSATREGIIVGGWISVIGTLILAFGAQYLNLTLPLTFLGGQVAGFVGLVSFILISLFTNTAEYEDLKDKEVKEVIDIGRLQTDRQPSESDVLADD